MVNVDCQSRRSTKISVIILGAALCSVMMAYFVFGDNNDEQGLRNLRMISIVFRHGEKTPSSFYATDPHSLHDWPGGLGALTQRGSQQAYNLGKNLRMRYYRLLPPNGIYTQQQVLALSSAAERCIMSAQSVLAGFMPPLDHNKVLPIPWQPAAVNVIPRNEDTLLAQKKPCLKYDTILQKLYKNPPPDVRQLNEENAELFKLLTKHSGKNISTLTDVEMLYTTLKAEAEAGLVLPDWTENIYPEKLEALAARSYSLYTESNLMKKVKGGAFLAEIIKKMENKRRKNLNPDRKIFLYSGHDITLVNIMNTLSILAGGYALVSYFYGKSNDEVVKRLQEETQNGKMAVGDPLEFLIRAVRIRLEMIIPYKSQWSQALALMALPQNAATSLAQVLTLVDDICYYAGDRSVDFGWYTRRVGLATIMKMTELFMLQDSSVDHANTWEFLRNRMDEAVQVQTILSETEGMTHSFTRSFNSAFITARNILGIDYRRR